MMRDKGLTLIELVVAMSVFALVATMGIQTLSGSLRLRDRLVETDNETAALGMTVALLRTDVAAAVPLLFYAPGGSPLSAIDLSPGGQTFSVSTGGQPDLPSSVGLGVHRVEWRVDPGAQVLLRRSWPTLYPASPGQVSVEVPMLDGVTSFSIRSYFAGSGWMNGTSFIPPGGQSVATSAQAQDADGAQGMRFNRYSSRLPDAVEIVIQTADTGTITLLESFK